MRGTSHYSVTIAFVAAIHLLLLPGAIAFGAESIVTNGDFQKWTDGVPDGWEVEIGAMNGGEEPKSEVKGIKGPALMLRGDASTMAWHAVSQEIPATPRRKLPPGVRNPAPRTSGVKAGNTTTATWV